MKRHGGGYGGCGDSIKGNSLENLENRGRGEKHITGLLAINHSMLNVLGVCLFCWKGDDKFWGLFEDQTEKDAFLRGRRLGF